MAGDSSSNVDGIIGAEYFRQMTVAKLPGGLTG